MAASTRWSAVLVAVALTGCSSGSGSAPHAARPTQTLGFETSNTDDPIARGPFVMPGATEGGTVTVLTHDGLQGTLDPSEVYAPDVLSIDRGLLTRSLTQYRYDSPSRQMVLVPDLATSLGSHNDDYTRWLFTIRTGVRFEDGERVTAADVVRGIRRCLHATTFPTGPCQTYANGKVRSVQAVHRDEDVEIRLRTPFPDLPYFASFPEMGPVPAAHSLDPTTYRLHPLATGPYKIADYVRGKRPVLVRNSLWDAQSDTTRTQYPDRYVFRAGVPTRQIVRTLRRDAGDGRTTLTYDGLSPHAFTEFRASAHDRLVLGGRPCTTYVAPDNRSVTSPLVRRALAFAYPYRSMVRLDGGIPGVTAVPATNVVPPFALGRTAYPRQGRGAFRSEPSSSRALLRRAHALGFEIRFSFDPRDPTSVRTQEVLAAALRRGGFRPQPVETPPGIALTPGAEPEVNLRTTARCGDWPAESAWVPALFGSTRPGRTGSLGENLAAFSHPCVDRALARIRRLPLDLQSAAYNRLEHDVLNRWFPAFPVSYGGVDMAHGSRLRGMADDDTLGMPTWHRIWVSP